VPVLHRFDTPARLPEPTAADRDAWSVQVGGVVASLAADNPQFFDPTRTDVGPDVQAPVVAWTAFPATLLEDATSEEQRWAAADASRSVQDEYCEWSIERDGDGVITRVTFTTEVPEYFEHLAARDPDRLLAVYHDFVGPQVWPEELVVDGQYRRDNVHNRSTEGRLAHLMQGSNTLVAALVLAAKATILRHAKDGEPVTSPQEPTACGGLANRCGTATRRSPPRSTMPQRPAPRSRCRTR
jgi:hypothetical protein